MHQEFRIESLNAFLFVSGGLLIPFVIFMLVFSVGNLAQVRLYAWIVCSVVAVLAKVRHREKFSKYKSRELHGKDTFQVSFICLTSIISVAAVLVFMLLPTTNKTLSPENSRGKNKECVTLGFFDWHNLWHFLFSLALLMGAFFVMFISFEPEQCPQAKTRGNNEPGASSNLAGIVKSLKRYVLYSRSYMKR